MRTWPLFAILVLAACKAKKESEAKKEETKAEQKKDERRKEESKPETMENEFRAKKIPGGSAQSYRGVSFDLPKGWRAAPLPDEILPGAKSLTPEGANPGGVIEEAYVLIGDPASPSIDGEDFPQGVEKLLAAVQPGLERQGPGERKKFGDLDGRYLRYTGKTEDGRKVEARVFGFLGNCSCALVVLGVADAVAKRDADVAAILGSMSKAGGGAPAEELAGQWAWITSFNANTGGGRTTSKILTLRADGTYEFHAENDSSGTGEGFNWGAWSKDSDGGSWTATAATITFKSRSGGEKTYSLEKRNHPKNVNDPMIVLDGQPFVTATRREPW